MFKSYLSTPHQLQKLELVVETSSVRRSCRQEIMHECFEWDEPEDTFEIRVHNPPTHARNATFGFPTFEEAMEYANGGGGWRANEAALVIMAHRIRERRDLGEQLIKRIVGLPLSMGGTGFNYKNKHDDKNEHDLEDYYGIELSAEYYTPYAMHMAFGLLRDFQDFLGLLETQHIEKIIELISEEELENPTPAMVMKIQEYLGSFINHSVNRPTLSKNLIPFCEVGVEAMTRLPWIEADGIGYSGHRMFEGRATDNLFPGYPKIPQIE